MIRRVFLLFAFVGALAQAAPPLEIVGAEFGLFAADQSGEIAFTPAAVVPFREGQRYGWVIEVRTKKRSLSVREEYLLPTAATEARTTPGPSGGVMPLPRRVQVSQRQLVPVGGRIVGEWAIGPGEPPGRRHLQVIVEERLAGDFEFELK